MVLRQNPCPSKLMREDRDTERFWGTDRVMIDFPQRFRRPIPFLTQSTDQKRGYLRKFRSASKFGGIEAEWALGSDPGLIGLESSSFLF